MVRQRSGLKKINLSVSERLLAFTPLLIKHTQSAFEIRSGNHRLVLNDDGVRVEECDFWQGTIVYMQLRTDVEIDPNAVVEHRTDVEDEYEIMFNDNNPSELW